MCFSLNKFIISGAKETDYSCSEDSTAPCSPAHHGGTDGPAKTSEAPDTPTIGTLTFISCGAGSEQPMESNEIGEEGKKWGKR